MTATPTPLRELPAKWRAIAAEAERIAAISRAKHIPDEWNEAKSQFIKDCADELEPALSARDEADGEDRARKLYEPDEYEDAFKGRATPPASGEAGAVEVVAYKLLSARGVYGDSIPAIFAEKCADDLLGIATPPAASGDVEKAIRGVAQWLLHRFGPNTPEANEATALHAAADRLAAVAPAGMGYQERVGKWMDACFPRALYGDMTQRCDRFLEEALELLQAQGYDPGRVATLVEYVWGRPVGDPKQEVGGTVVTLAALCWVAGIDMQGEATRELARIEQPKVMAKIRAKQEAKNALHFDSPLPGSAAAPTLPATAGKE